METIFKYCTTNDALYNLITFDQQQRFTRRLSEKDRNIIVSQARMIDRQLGAWDRQLKDFEHDIDKVRKEASDFNDKLQLATLLTGSLQSITKIVHLGYKSAATSGKSLEHMNKRTLNEMSSSTAEKALFLGGQTIDSNRHVQGEVKDAISTAISVFVNLNPIGLALNLTPIFINLYHFGSTNPNRYFEKMKEEGIQSLNAQKMKLLMRRNDLYSDLRRVGLTPYQTLSNPFN